MEKTLLIIFAIGLLLVAGCVETPPAPPVEPEEEPETTVPPVTPPVEEETPPEPEEVEPQPEPEPETQPENETEAEPELDTEGKCVAAGGTWTTDSKGVAKCYLPTSDAGKACTSSDQCESFCVSTAPYAVSGICYEYKTLNGCWFVIEDGVATEVCN